MQAAERFFEGEFADIEEADGDVSMEPATPMAPITPSRTPRTVVRSPSLLQRMTLTTFD
jgi:hypothetical protein